MREMSCRIIREREISFIVSPIYQHNCAHCCISLRLIFFQIKTDKCSLEIHRNWFDSKVCTDVKISSLLNRWPQFPSPYKRECEVGQKLSEIVEEAAEGASGDEEETSEGQVSYAQTALSGGGQDSDYTRQKAVGHREKQEQRVSQRIPFTEGLLFTWY